MDDKKIYKFMLQNVIQKCVNMSSTITIRIPRELKERMKKIPTQWSEEIRGFIEERVKHLELINTIKEVEPRAEKRVLKVDSTPLIREDRER